MPRKVTRSAASAKAMGSTPTVSTQMGSTWLREVTKDDPVRQKAALEFQRTVDGLFNFRGMRGESREAAIRLARKFREMAGFASEEIDDIAAMAESQRAERVAAPAAQLAVAQRAAVVVRDGDLGPAIAR